MAAKQQDKTFHRVMVGILAGSMLCVVGLLGYIASFRANYPRYRRPNPRSEARFVASKPMREMLLSGMSNPVFTGSGFASNGGGGLRPPQGFSRYFANLSTPVGKYIVSVRQVADFEQGITLYENTLYGEARRPMTRVNFSLQVIAAAQDDMDQVVDFAAHLKATDDKGVVHDSQAVSPLTQFPKGNARSVFLPTPSVGATRYTRVTGSLRVKTRNGTETDLPFTLTNIPLPMENHLFGVSSASLLPQTAALAAEGKGILRGEAARPWEKLFPPFVAEASPLGFPGRLILILDQPNRFSVYLAARRGYRELVCTLTPHLETDGKIIARIRVEAPNGGKMLEWQSGFWDNEPFLLTFDAHHFFADMTGMAGVRLHLYSHLWSETLPTVSPIPAKKSTKTGMIVVRASVTGQPLQFGQAVFHLVRKQGTEIEQGNVTVDLDFQGEGRVHNVPPGTYDITLKELLPYHSSITAASRPAVALSRRYGLVHPRVTDGVQKNLTLRAGSQLRTREWQVRD